MQVLKRHITAIRSQQRPGVKGAKRWQRLCCVAICHLAGVTEGPCWCGTCYVHSEFTFYPVINTFQKMFFFVQAFIYLLYDSGKHSLAKRWIECEFSLRGFVNI